ncbi:MAG: class I SAM-dependent methyltransferase [Planctomycetota bacterium]|nr:MAG: class I SAM-dependent methyltransferase [Planctomycetota bacterium]
MPPQLQAPDPLDAPAPRTPAPPAQPGSQHPAATPAAPQTAPTGYRHIELEYPVHPRPRPLLHGVGGKRLLATLDAAVPYARTALAPIAQHHDLLRKIPVHRTPELHEREPNWCNGWFPAVDAAVLYGLLVQRNPRLYVEVGSGNSTRFARRAIREHGLRTRIISIDPCPRAEIDALCDESLRMPLEGLDLGAMQPLCAEDLLFIDSSHRTLQNSDVTVFFLEVLPALPPGLLFGLHDVFLPQDYPEPWIERFYSEQYLLASYLLGGADGDAVRLPLAYLHGATRELDVLAPLFDALELPIGERFGNAFWMQKRPR